MDSPASEDAIISRDQLAMADDPAGVKYYGGAVIAESIAPRNKPIIKAAPALLEACKLWLEAIQNSLGLRLALTNLPEGAGPVLVEILQEAIAAAEPSDD